MELSARLQQGLLDHLIERCAGLPLAREVLGNAIGWRADKGSESGLKRAAGLARTLVDGKVPLGAELEERLYHVLTSSIQALPPAVQRAFMDIVWYYAPREVPWQLVEVVLDEEDQDPEVGVSAAARQMGHKLGRWRKVKRFDVWAAKVAAPALNVWS